MSEEKHYIVDADVLPEIYLKAYEAKRLLDSGRANTVRDAVRKVGVSRSAFYKYKDAIKPFKELDDHRMVTFYALLRDEPGILSSLLDLIARSGANILTINQNIPINGEANVTITLRTGEIPPNAEDLTESAARMPGVLLFEIISRE